MQRDLSEQVASIQDWRANRSLTVRERQVAQLIARGYSNREIAQELVIASSTAERHVANILTKLKVRSRAEIAVWAVEHRLVQDQVHRVRGNASSAADRWPMLPQRRQHLPAQLTSLIGRERELAELSQLLQANRLITLTGAGGVGKTRLALQAAGEIAHRYADGVWLVDLAPLTNPELVEHAVATAVGVREGADQPVLDTLVTALGPHELLLLLDNCEHLIEASARLADALVRACPFVHVLATTRERLGITGEATLIVPPLRTPDPERLPEPGFAEPVRGCAAPGRPLAGGRVELCRDSAERARCGTDLPSTGRDSTRNRLAAARMNVLTAEQMADRLADRFRLLTGGSRSASPRQQTLRATIDWSYALLTETEQVMFRRVGVFAGGWTLETAEAVCGPTAPAGHELGPSTGTDPGPLDTLNYLSSLVSKSLVAIDERDGAKRYRLLDTIRQYAVDLLATVGDASAVRRRHAEYYVTVAEQAEPHFGGADQLHWFRRLETEHDNMRVALDCLLEDDSMDLASRLGAALWRFWNVHCHFREGSQWLERMLAKASAPSAARGRVLMGAGYLVLALDEPQRAMALHEEAVAVLEAHGEARDVAMAWRSLGRAALRLRDLPRAYSALQKALATLRELDDAWGIAACLHNLGNVATAHGEDQKAAALYTEALERRQRLGDLSGIASSMSNLGYVALRAGEFKRGVRLIEQALPLQRELGMPNEIADSLSLLGHAARRGSELDRATALFEEALLLRRRFGNKRRVGIALTDLAKVALQQRAYERTGQLLSEALALQSEPIDTVTIVPTFETVAELSAAQGYPTSAARLLGAADALRDSMGTPRGAIGGADYARTVSSLHASLGNAAVMSDLVAGRDMSIEGALAEAHSILQYTAH